MSMSVEDRTEEELKKIAKDIVSGHIFTDRHLKDKNDFTHVFMIAAFWEEKHWISFRDGDIGLCYEYMDKAGPRTINGLPSFLSIQFLNKKDTEKLAKYVVKIQEALNSI
jgi:hypothetical protein